MPTSRTFMPSSLAVGLAIGLAVAPTQLQAVNEIAEACQLPGAYLTETGLERIVTTGVTTMAAAYFNPVDDYTTRQRSKLRKAATMLGGGVALMTMCPPLVVPEGFREDWSEQQRLDYALQKNWDLSGISDMNFDVDNPADPQSCSKTLTTSINGSGQLLEGGDFTELEFVYVEPFGTFPSAVSQYDEVVRRIQEEVESLLNNYLTNLEPFESAIASVEDFTNSIDSALADVGLNPNLSSFIPDIREYLLELIGLALTPSCNSVDLECEFRRQFDFWGTDLPELVNAGLVERPGGGDTFLFPDGPSKVRFDSDINTGFSTEIRYTQDIFVKEYFPPTFNVIENNGVAQVERDRDNQGNPIGPNMNIIADYTFEALEPGRAVTTFTPPSELVGAIAVADNCDPAPKLTGGIPNELPLGVHYLPVWAVDRTFNQVGDPTNNARCSGIADPFNPNDDPACEIYAIKVTVTDTRPPDVLEPDPIGIAVSGLVDPVNFTDTNIGCVDFNCQQVRTDANLYPPALFDFASDATTIDVQCAVSNSLEAQSDCAFAQLPVGETSTIEWTFSDTSGNTSTVTQLAAVRQSGSNQSPSALGTNVEIAAGTTAPIPLQASDPEFDPIRFDVRSLPSNGTLNVSPDPIFQTRLSLTGTLTDLTDAVHVQGQTNNGRSADVLADPVGRRLLAVNDIKVIDALYFDAIRPDSISLRDSDFIVDDNVFNQPGGTPSALTANLLIGDWSQRRIYGLVDNPSGNEPEVVPDAGLALPAAIENPAHFEMIGSRLVITDPHPTDPTQGQVHVLVLGNVSESTTPADWTISSLTSTTPGFNASAISLPAPVNGCPVFSSIDSVMLGDWDNQQIRSASIPTNNLVYPATTWDVSDYLRDPDGEARPDLGAPQDMALLSDDCRATTSDPFRLVVIDDANKNFEALTLSASNTTPSATPETEQSLTSEFSRLFGVEALTDTEFMTLESGRIARFDIFGNLLASLQTLPQDSSAILDGDFDSRRLVPLDASSWAAMASNGNGDAYVLSFGNDATQTTNVVTRFQLADGHNNATEIATQTLQVTAEFSTEKGRSIAYSPGQMSGNSDDRVYALTDNGLERFDAGLSGSEVLYSNKGSPCTGSWCTTMNNEFPVLDHLDVAADGMGNVYISDLANDRVHKFAHDGSYFGWLGRCDSGSRCDVANNRSIGFSCTAATCSVSSASGNADGQFDFVDEPVNQDKPRVSSGNLHVSLDAQQIYITDNPNFGAGAVPRVQIFSLSGSFVSATVPNAQPGDLLDFLDEGEFNTINDLSTTANRLFVIEDLPLTRLHLFDVNPFTATLDGAVVEYTPNIGFTGVDSFSYSVTDSFGAESLEAPVNVTVVADPDDPVITFCPAPITVEISEPDGARAHTNTPGDTGSVALADWFASVEFTDNVMTPAPRLVVQSEYLPDPDFFPINATTGVQFTVFDSSNNFALCESSVTVVDTIAPQVNQPDDIVEEATGSDPDPRCGDFTVNDLGKVVIECFPTRVDPDAPNSGAIGAGQSDGAPARSVRTITKVTLTATDEGGNSKTSTRFITQVDTQAPEILLPVTKNGGSTVLAAINGYANPYSIPTPVGSDAGGLDGPVVCQPALSGTAAAVPLEFMCVARDLGGNVGRAEFSYEIRQLNADGDAFADVIDPQPGVADNSATFSDVPLGGNTSGTYTAGAAGAFEIKDAWLEQQGVRAEWVAPDTGTTVNTAVISACNDVLQVSNFGIKLDEVGDIDVSAASVSCAPAAVRNHLGSVTASWVLPNALQAVAQLPESAGLTIDDFIASAAPENQVDVLVNVADNVVTLAPGQSVDLQSSANFSPVAAPVAPFSLLEDTANLGQLDLAGVFEDQEDADEDLSFGVQAESGAGLLDVLEVNGAILSFSVAPDAFGVARLIASATDTQGLTGTVAFDVVIQPVNDAPLLSLLGNIAAGDSAGQVRVDGFALATPGPANEDDQVVSISIVNVSAPALFASGPSIDANGSLSFTPVQGQAGNASVLAMAMDDGGTENGGVNTTEQAFEISIDTAAQADLGISISANEVYVAVGQEVLYTVVVTNDGPAYVDNVVVESLLPQGLVNASWICSASGGDCGQSAGVGDIVDNLSLQAGGEIIYSMTATVAQAEGDYIMSAANVIPPLDPSDSNPANDSDQVRIRVGLFLDRFESQP